MANNNQGDRDRLTRTEERIKALADDVEGLHDTIDEVRDDAKERYVTKDEYKAAITPVLRAFYTIGGGILAGIITFIIQWFMKGGGSLPPGGH